MLSMGWFIVWIRHVKVWQKILLPSVISKIGEPLLYLLAFGFGLGQYIGSMMEMPYIVFLASGIICSSGLTTATFEGLYSAYTRMAVQQTWQAMLTAPLSISDVVLGEAIWAGTKSTISAAAIIIVAVGFGLVHDWRAVLVLPVVLLMGTTFGAMALVMTAVAKSYDFFLYYFTLVITPMILLSGVFFPQSSLPPALQMSANLFPLSHSVALVRPLMTGGVVEQPALHLAVILVYGLVAFSIAHLLIKRRLMG